MPENNLEESDFLLETITNLISQKKWGELSKFFSEKSLYKQNSNQTNFDPIPRTLGDLCMAILWKSSPDTDIHIHVQKNSLSLVENLKSNKEATVFYSYNLLNACVSKFSESFIHVLVSHGVFKNLSRIKLFNTIELSHKIYRKRERAQRVFLKNNGFEVVVSSLDKYSESTSDILKATVDLLIVKNN